ncbi:MAG: acyl-CoA thioesterase [Bdellovibrionia bacterium]
METKKHCYPLTILESHLDTFGHVNNAAYLQIFEEARWDLITGNGYGLDYILECGLGPVILEVNLRFHKELKLRKKVVIETTLKAYDKMLATIVQKIVDADGQNYCSAEFRFGLFDLKARKLVLPTPAWLNGIGVNSN